MRYDDLNKLATDQPIIFHFERVVTAQDQLMVTVTATIYLVQGQVFEWVFTHSQEGILPPRPKGAGSATGGGSYVNQRRDSLKAQCKEHCEEVADALKVRFPSAIFTGPALPCQALMGAEADG